MDQSRKKNEILDAEWKNGLDSLSSACAAEGGRKELLFAVACCRAPSFWEELLSPESRAAVLAAKSHADERETP